MREILFRGQTRRRGEKVNMKGDKLPGRWVYGGVLQGPGDFSIIYGGENLGDIEKHTVYTDTIGQYTGRDVKTGKVFEGDIGKAVTEYFLWFGMKTILHICYSFMILRQNCCTSRKCGTTVKLSATSMITRN